MNKITRILALAILLCLAQIGMAQTAGHRFASMTNESGSAFFALDGTTGQLYFMQDVGYVKGTWKAYGNKLRAAGSDNLQFVLLTRKGSGNIFYALESNTGQLHWMADFGDTRGEWKSYGQPIRATGKNNLQFNYTVLDDGTKFTAMDGETGQVYFMFDFGMTRGTWNSYGQTIK